MGDILGGGIGLLGSEAALLDRERRPVARRVDVMDTFYSGVIVDRDEALVISGQAVDRRSLHQRQGDHLGRAQCPIAGTELDSGIVELAHGGAREEVDPTGVEQLSDSRAGRWPEYGKGSGFRCHYRDFDVEPPIGRPALRHQGDLVQRQRPGDAVRNDEGHPMILPRRPIQDFVGPVRLTSA